MDELRTKIKDQIGLVKFETIVIDGAVNAIIEKYGSELKLPDEVINMSKIMTNMVETLESLCENVIVLEMETNKKVEKIEELLDKMLKEEQTNKKVKEIEMK